MQVVVSDTATAAAHAAAVTIAGHLNAAIGERGEASLALSGGKTPKPMVRHLAALTVAWDRVHVWQVDERAVGAQDPDRNWLSFHATVTICASASARTASPLPSASEASDRAKNKWAATSSCTWLTTRPAR